MIKLIQEILIKEKETRKEKKKKMDGILKKMKQSIREEDAGN